MITLQCCIGFCHTSTWISHRYTHVLSLLNLPLTYPPQLPPHPTPLGCHRALSWVPCIVQQLPISYLFYTWWYIYFNAIFSVRPTHSFPHKERETVHKSVLYVSVPPLQIGSSVPILLDSICVNIWYLFYSFWLFSLCIIDSRLKIANFLSR